MSTISPTQQSRSGSRITRSLQITEILRDEILAGQFREGERLPSERDLSQRFSANRGAVREAMKKLEQLGLTHIQPGGARVASLATASLEAMGHLLALEQLPAPELIGQVLEAFRSIVEAAQRLAIERAGDAELSEVAGLVERLAHPRVTRSEQTRLELEISEWFFDHCGNFVLTIIRRSIASQIAQLTEDSARRAPLAKADVAKLAKQFARALRARDPDAAVIAMRSCMELRHQQILGNVGAASPRSSRKISR